MEERRSDTNGMLKENIPTLTRTIEYQKKRNEVEKMFRDFKYLSVKQIREITKDSNMAASIITELKESQAIKVMLNESDRNAKASVYTTDLRLQDIKMRKYYEKYNKALWVYLDFKKKEALKIGSYAIPDNDKITLTFEINGMLCDVIVVESGGEIPLVQYIHAVERYLPEKDVENLHRIVVIDDEKQKSIIEEYGGIKGTDFYVTIDEFGDTTYSK